MAQPVLLLSVSPELFSACTHTTERCRQTTTVVPAGTRPGISHPRSRAPGLQGEQTVVQGVCSAVGSCPAEGQDTFHSMFLPPL